MLIFIHVLSACLWLGTATTLPFWGKKMNEADHLHTVLGIVETVFKLKVVLIMGGLMSTLITGFMLVNQYYGSFIAPRDTVEWLFVGQLFSLYIFCSSWLIFYFLVVGRKGKRSLMRIVPTFGYTNVGLIAIVVYLMVVKPAVGTVWGSISIALGIIIFLNIVNVVVKFNKKSRLKSMSSDEFAAHYFGLLNDENMAQLFKLFDDNAEFYDPFATQPVIGILAVEQFFQKLGDQYDTIKIKPIKVEGPADDIMIHWEANGVTQNGSQMTGLKGTNNMKRKNGIIYRVDINFDLADLPPIQRVTL
ncbi:MAG: nuclear transport factor 2 family protein [Algicola sp.]|nr:nuclear transport factor 2 family protein [Algicola sp.]